jgi:single-stranded DNA-binding protein
MSVAKAVVTGTVYRAPEKRFTQNNVAVSDFVLDIGDGVLLRVLSKRQFLDAVVDGTLKGDHLLVEGRLQVAAVKNNDGTERKIFEIDANAIEKMSGEGATSAPVSKFGTEEIVKFESDDFSDELIGEDEIPF